MKPITKNMIKIYNLNKWCFMGFALDKQASFHHIEKRCDGGKEVISNGAVLNKEAHEYLHILEYKDMDTYTSINKILKYINEQKNRPTEEQYEIINYLLEKFEDDHWEDKTSKGKRLIKPKYLERKYYKGRLI